MKKSFGLFQQKKRRGVRRTGRSVQRSRKRSEEDRYDRDDYDEEEDRYDRDDYDEEDDAYDREDDEEYDRRSDRDDDRYDQDDYDQDDYDQDDYEDGEHDRYDDDDDYGEDELNDQDGDEEENDLNDDYEDDRENDEISDDDRYEDDGYQEDRKNRRNDPDEYEEEYEDYEDDGDDGYEDDYDEDEDDAERRRPLKGTHGRKRSHKKAVSFLKHSSAMERVALLAGGIIIAVGISVGTLFAQAQARNKEVASFKNVGTQLDGVKVIGESGLLAVADAQQAKIAASDAASSAASVGASDEEGIKVRMTLATIKKDIKIKFINRATGKLIASVPFTVKVDGPNGSKTYDDDDMDGIIYKSDIAAGTYKVTVSPLDEKYSKYTISDDTQKITVKDTIVYKKVDVKDEIKTEAQVNVAKEDTQVQNTPVESANKDTVEWVESTKTEIGSDDSTTAYSAIDKSTIADPTASARLDVKGLSMFANSGASASVNAASSSTTKPASAGSSGTSNASTEATTKKEAPTYKLSQSTVTLTVGDSATVTASSANLSDTSVKWESADASVATVDNGKITAVKAGSTSITVTFSDKHTETVKVTVNDKTYTISSVSIDKTSIVAGGTATLTAVTEPKGGTVTWKSSDEKIATVKDSTVTGVAAGTATLTATVGSSTKTLTVTVTSDKASVTLNATKLTLLVGKTSTLKATVTDLSSTKVTWTSSDESVAKVSSAGKVTAVKAGTATITATSTADTTKTATCAVTVADSASVLKDKSGNVVYILKDGTYVQATYADYFTASKFYVQTAGKKYKYTGWQTIDGKTYFYDKDGNVITGEQTIQGVKYTFGSDGALQTGSGNMGIDVSKWNGNIDWAAVKNSGVSFVIIRCGYRGSSTGALIEDPKFRSNINGATAAGLKVGVYFFTQAISDVEAVEEASMVADLCSGHGLSYPVYLDVEGSNGRGDAIDAATRTTVCKAFCATMANAGYGTGIYANKTWLTSRINTSSLTGYKIWLAQYAANPTYSATRYDMWQYTSRGSVTGISGRVDMNICY